MSLTQHDEAAAAKANKLASYGTRARMVQSNGDIHVPNAEGELAEALKEIYELDSYLFWSDNRTWFEKALEHAGYKKQPDTGKTYLVWKKK